MGDASRGICGHCAKDAHGCPLESRATLVCVEYRPLDAAAHKRATEVVAVEFRTAKGDRAWALCEQLQRLARMQTGGVANEP